MKMAKQVSDDEGLRGSSFGVVKLVAYACYSHNVGRVLRVLLDESSEAADVDIDVFVALQTLLRPKHDREAGPFFRYSPRGSGGVVRLRVDWDKLGGGRPAFRRQDKNWQPVSSICWPQCGQKGKV